MENSQSCKVSMSIGAYIKEQTRDTYQGGTVISLGDSPTLNYSKVLACSSVEAANARVNTHPPLFLNWFILCWVSEITSFDGLI